MKQTILGSGGGIGTPLARELRNYTDQIRLVSRNPKRVNETDELFAADVNDFSQVEKAVDGSETVYVTVGFEYNLKVWRSVWPPFMQAVIDACIKHKARLVFFDNVYLYDRSAIPFMTESSAINPPSEKGKVREKVFQMIMEAVEKGKLTGLIARSADFYGPKNKNSPLTIMVAENLMKGKKAQVFGNVDRIHTFTFTPDAAKATALLGNHSDAYNNVWHLPTTKERLTNRQWIELIAREINMEPRFQTISKLMMKLLGVVMPVMKEFPEMLYQYENDYIFDSTKFEERFGIYATPPVDGIKRLIKSLKM